MQGTIVLSKEQRERMAKGKKHLSGAARKLVSRVDVINYHHQAGRVAFTGGVKPLKEKA